MVQNAKDTKGFRVKSSFLSLLAPGSRGHQCPQYLEESFQRCVYGICTLHTHTHTHAHSYWHTGRGRYSNMYISTHVYLLSQPFLEGNSDCFQSLAITSSASMDR